MRVGHFVRGLLNAPAAAQHLMLQMPSISVEHVAFQHGMPLAQRIYHFSRNAFGRLGILQTSLGRDGRGFRKPFVETPAETTIAIVGLWRNQLQSVRCE